VVMVGGGGGHENEPDDDGKDASAALIFNRTKRGSCKLNAKEVAAQMRLGINACPVSELTGSTAGQGSVMDEMLKRQC
jgi:hypothetical protein